MVFYKSNFSNSNPISEIILCGGGANFSKIDQVLKEKLKKNKKIKTHKRNLVIVPELVGINIQVHNGKEFVPVEITGEMLGHKLGEFSLTRSKVVHAKAGIGATKGSKFKAKK